MPATDVSDSSWDEKVLGSKIPVVVGFWAPWCPWSRRFMPEFDALSDEYEGRLEFLKINAGQYPDIASKYGVNVLSSCTVCMMCSPTVKLFCAGNPVAETAGYLSKTSLREQLDRMLTKCNCPP